MKKLLVVISLVLLMAAFLSADVYIKSSIHTGAFEMMGQKQPAKDETSEQWIGKNKFAQINPQQQVILNLDKKLMHVVYHATKSYVEAALPLDMAKLLPEQVAKMMSMMKITVTVNPNGQTKKVGKWSCTGYDVTMDMMMMKMKMTIWATTDVPFDWAAYSQNMMPQVMKMGGQMLDEAAVKEFQKIKGFNVLTEMSMDMMGSQLKVTTKVTEISTKTPPAGTYDFPKDYKKQDKLTMKRGM